MDVSALKKLANTIRVVSAGAVEKANSGHPGMPMGMAEVGSVLFSETLRFNPKDPAWAGRDRFVLSAGHGSMLLYSLLHLFGFKVGMEDIKNFRQLHSITPGHPEFGITPGVECTTGPLGQGVANGVGMALSGKLLEARYGTSLLCSRVFGIVSDGDLMEGIAQEAVSVAGHLGLDNLTYIYDDNDISIGGHTDLCFSEDVPARFKSVGWDVITVDGNSVEQVYEGLSELSRMSGKPKLLVAKSIIGLGSPKKANTADVHGAPLGKDEFEATRTSLNWQEQSEFSVSKDVESFCASVQAEKIKQYDAWQKEWQAWGAKNPEKLAKYNKQASGELSEDLLASMLDVFKEPKKDASRNMSGQVLQVLSEGNLRLIGGSADLEPSNKTLIKKSSDVSSSDFNGVNLRFGIREHAMGAIANGLAYDGRWLPYTATFLVFSDYMRPPMRLAALSHLQAIFIFTHDSFWVGEDGPTHQPIEHIQSLRLIPNLYVFRPADGRETALSYWAACNLKKSPSTILLTRQNIDPLKRDKEMSPADFEKGAYIVSGDGKADLAIVATGSEVALAIEAAEILRNEKKLTVRVISMPCVELYLQQDKAWRESVLPESLPCVSLEAGATQGWEAVVGSKGLKIGIDHFGASAPGEVLAEEFGFTANKVANKIRAWLG